MDEISSTEVEKLRRQFSLTYASVFRNRTLFIGCIPV